MAAAPASGPFFHRVALASPSSAADPHAGMRFCFFHAPAAGSAPRGCVLAVHAFAEEMNKTRAAAADGARALAAAGYAVLQIDLAGCGDSAGDFEDATWSGWLADLTEAWAWLHARCPGPRWVWGTRLGVLLADQFTGTCVPHADGLLLWQPVVNGAQHLGQFLRLKTIGGMLRAGGPAAEAAATVAVARVAQASPRADLAAGRTVEVAGYALTPGLADAIEAARLGAHASGVPPRVRWLEVVSPPAATSEATNPAPATAMTTAMSTAPAISPVAAKIVERWRAAGSDVDVVQVVGPAFWQTQEVERCRPLVDATVEALAA